MQADQTHTAKKSADPLQTIFWALVLGFILAMILSESGIPFCQELATMIAMAEVPVAFMITLKKRAAAKKAADAP